MAIWSTRSISTSPTYTTLWAEHFALIYARSLTEAEAAAEARGRSEECTYRNVMGEEITVVFERLIDVNAALNDDLTVDADLYSRSFEYPSYRTRLV